MATYRTQQGAYNDAEKAFCVLSGDCVFRTVKYIRGHFTGMYGYILADREAKKPEYKYTSKYYTLLDKEWLGKRND